MREVRGYFRKGSGAVFSEETAVERDLYDIRGLNNQNTCDHLGKEVLGEQNRSAKAPKPERVCRVEVQQGGQCSWNRVSEREVGEMGLDGKDPCRAP